MSLDRALSDALRARLHVEDEVRPALATAAEMRALRAMLRLSQPQLARRLGVAVSTVIAWECGHRPVAPAKVATRTRLTQDLAEARALEALRCDPRTWRKPSPRRERPPDNLLYACTKCGARPAALRCWVERKADRETVWHYDRRRSKCGPVQPGGLVHRAAVLAERGA